MGGWVGCGGKAGRMSCLRLWALQQHGQSHMFTGTPCTCSETEAGRRQLSGGWGVTDAEMLGAR